MRLFLGVLLLTTQTFALDEIRMQLDLRVGDCFVKQLPSGWKVEGDVKPGETPEQALKRAQAEEAPKYCGTEKDTLLSEHETASCVPSFTGHYSPFRPNYQITSIDCARTIRCNVTASEHYAYGTSYGFIRNGGMYNGPKLFPASCPEAKKLIQH